MNWNCGCTYCAENKVPVASAERRGGAVPVVVYYEMGFSSLCARSVLATSREAVVLEDGARDERRRRRDVLFVILFCSYTGK